MYKTEILQESKILAGFNSFFEELCNRFRRTDAATTGGGYAALLPAKSQKQIKTGLLGGKRPKKLRHAIDKA